MKKKFLLRKECTGSITIEDKIQDDKFSKGFMTPNQDGVAFWKFMKKLKDGDEITISLSKTKKIS